MTERELEKYMENKKAYYTQPEALETLASNVHELLCKNDFQFEEKLIACWTLELLCFTIHTSEGRELYLKLLNHLGKFDSKISIKYWKIFDSQENLKNRYNI